MKRAVLQNKRVGVLRMAFRARKVSVGTFEKRAPGQECALRKAAEGAHTLHVHWIKKTEDASK